MRRGGQAVFRRRFNIESIKEWNELMPDSVFWRLRFQRYLPPPLPFKVFVATAGTLEYPRWRFLLTVMVARSLRYYVEGVLAVFYGRRVLLFFKDNGVVIISIVATLGLIGFLIYMFINRRKNGRQPPHSSDNDSTRFSLKGSMVEVIYSPHY